MARKYLLLLAFAIFPFLNCTNNVGMEPESDYLIFGVYSGKTPAGAYYKIQDSALFRDMAKKNIPSKENGLTKYNFTGTGIADYNIARQIFDFIPAGLWEETDKTIGLPDVTDGGGVYIEKYVNGNRDFKMIDNITQNIPEEYHGLVNETHNIISELIELAARY